MFDQSHLFIEKEILIYGKPEKVSLTTAHLFWKPTSSIICFVITLTSRGPIILMCNILQQNPWLALQLYCSRTRTVTIVDPKMRQYVKLYFQFKGGTVWVEKLQQGVEGSNSA